MKKGMQQHAPVEGFGVPKRVDLQLLQVVVDGSQHFLGDLATGETSDHLQGHATGHADLRVGGQFGHVLVDDGARACVVEQFANFGVNAVTHGEFLFCSKSGGVRRVPREKPTGHFASVDICL